MHCLVQKIRCIHLFKDETGFQILWMERDSDGSWVRVTAQRQGRWSLASDGESRGKCGQLPKLRLIVLMSASALCVLPGARPIVSTKSRVSLVIKVRLGAQAELRAGWGHTHSRLSSEHTQTKHQPSDLFTKQIPPPRSGIPLLSSLSWNIAGECCQWSPGARFGHRQQKLDKWSSVSASAPSLVIKMSCRPSLPAKIWTHTIRHPAIICTKQTTKLKV